MKQHPMSLPQKIRSVRKNLHHWMSLRQQNPVMGRDHLQETAERESMRLAGVLEQFENQQREQMARIDVWRKSRAQNGGDE
jgi:hypothetical protein